MTSGQPRLDQKVDEIHGTDGARRRYFSSLVDAENHQWPDRCAPAPFKLAESRWNWPDVWQRMRWLAAFSPRAGCETAPSREATEDSLSLQPVGMSDRRGREAGQKSGEAPGLRRTQAQPDVRSSFKVAFAFTASFRITVPRHSLWAQAQTRGGNPADRQCK